MAITMYSGAVPTFVQLLGGLKIVLQKAEEHVTAQKWDPAYILSLRLYPDMFTLERQVRQACTHAIGAGRVAGVSLPTLPDQDSSFAEMQTRIDKTLDFVKGLRPNQLDGKEDSEVTLVQGGQERKMKAQTYLTRRPRIISCAVSASSSASAISWAPCRRKPSETNLHVPSPPLRGEREGPAPKAWEGEVGLGRRSGIPHLTPTLSAPEGGEGVNLDGVTAAQRLHTGP